jgi:hypothetical protein
MSKMILCGTVWFLQGMNWNFPFQTYLLNKSNIVPENPLHHKVTFNLHKAYFHSIENTYEFFIRKVIFAFSSSFKKGNVPRGYWNKINGGNIWKEIRRITSNIEVMMMLLSCFYSRWTLILFVSNVLFPSFFIFIYK